MSSSPSNPAATIPFTVSSSKTLTGCLAASRGADLINRAIQRNGSATIILATGASQFEMLAELVQCNVPWDKVTCFHLDEYVGLAEDHPASFRKYLKERFLAKVSPQPAAFHFVAGEGDAGAECTRLNALLASTEVDVAFIGIGENGHLGFNDPPCNLETQDAFIVVALDEKCRQQQLGEGWFKALSEVPTSAITMSMPQILKAKALIVTVPDQRKADAVKGALRDAVGPNMPASLLQKHPNTALFLDQHSASLL